MLRSLAFLLCLGLAGFHAAPCSAQVRAQDAETRLIEVRQTLSAFELRRDALLSGMDDPQQALRAFTAYLRRAGTASASDEIFSRTPEQYFDAEIAPKLQGLSPEWVTELRKLLGPTLHAEWENQTIERRLQFRDGLKRGE